ncbi:hypothetical protein A3A71_01150 [Candidatus Berkelbacteria bacterium RIFCSPLOWO2_01_FULL_50_28]|uniref:Nucleoside 2-deoxyribosyltransferase n=1 Tax=Candidatus Berkelbacteria bacterium RIFCSPLOWO2_01_FULL_50_28 TaxID=1797471 RepID=A0A1F5EBP8_9BACT|nr:MAG: hypothetical protein A2807_01720 [Candidatus Berkelbacteria bacterium RIFCSPHIGHO2_01_FULL_50_36]OGD63486.1 MAG: hypothetical protein A3F39_03315 [Candidatus Berkelbacteria bacterium RIFCSPHIGHO2_12_FULL_50_11]OGD64644.1 MAG: hypothetical protein A3A71_01150 [Candidatus Berkelbacteria bacterium RIFCSPLOWO2_01_FULL_50_28]
MKRVPTGIGSSYQTLNDNLSSEASNSEICNKSIGQKFKTVTIIGSYRKHLDGIIKIKAELELQGVRVLSPRFTQPINRDDEFITFVGEEKMTHSEIEKVHLDSITKSDAVIVCDKGGYVGNATLFEIGYAYALGKRIIFTSKPEEYLLNILFCGIEINSTL